MTAPSVFGIADTKSDKLIYPYLFFVLSALLLPAIFGCMSSDFRTYCTFRIKLPYSTGTVPVCNTIPTVWNCKYSYSLESEPII
jgi:hypothetical protein